jgi:hypothetical protein
MINLLIICIFYSYVIVANCFEKKYKKKIKLLPFLPHFAFQNAICSALAAFNFNVFFFDTNNINKLISCLFDEYVIIPNYNH